MSEERGGMFASLSDHMRPKSIEEQLKGWEPYVEYGTVANGKKVFASHAHPRFTFYFVPLTDGGVSVLKKAGMDFGDDVLYRRRCIWSALREAGWEPQDWSEYPKRSTDGCLNGDPCDDCENWVFMDGHWVDCR